MLKDLNMNPQTIQLNNLLGRIGPLDEAAMEQARQRQDTLTKPLGSLGRLEELSVHVAGITGCLRPPLEHKVVFTFAGDHGVAAAGVSAYPSEVTPQMVYNFVRGGAAINVLARHVGARVVIADLGVAVDLDPHPEIIHRKVAYGTQNMVQGPAMSREQAVQAVTAGMDIFEAELERGVDLAATGDMGIGNTTPSSAIAAAFTGLPVPDLTGRGTGIDDARWAGKVRAIETALEVNQPDPSDALDVLAKVGGFEIGGLAGVILAAAAHRVPVVIDGFISGAAALIAAGLGPAVKPFLIAAHCSVEVGHRAMLQALGVQPLLDLGLRLGEGTGAALAMSLVEAAVKILNEMATFAEAGVAGKCD
jgi:nicotinate-nucleotide--dimethylbenzimidazole phosphoribosyltransferase